MVTLASPSFTSTPDTKVATTDAYSTTSTDVINDLVSKKSAFDIGMDELVEKSVKMSTGVFDSITSGKVDLASASSRVKAALGGNASAINSLARDVQASIGKELTGVDVTGSVKTATGLASSAQVLIGDVTRTFSTTSYKSAAGIVSMISGLGNNQVVKFLDLGAEAAILKGICQTVSSWQVPSLIDTVFGKAWNSTTNSYDYKYDASTRFSVVSRTAADLSPGTDLDTIIALLNAGGDTALTALATDFATNLLAQYSYPTTNTSTSYQDQLNKLLSIMDRIKPNWFYTWRNGVKVINFETMARVSTSAATLLKLYDPYRSAVVTAPNFSKVSAESLIKGLYPEAVWEGTT